MDLELTDRVVLVTGGTDGLGIALAESLVREGANVAVCGRDRGRLDTTATLLNKVGAGEAIAIQADVTVPEDLQRFHAAALDRWGRIDGVVNNAGRSSAGSIEAVDDDEWIYDIELKILAAVRLIRLALPQLRASGDGSIINTLNIGAKAPAAGSLPTSASRAAGLALTKSLSKELGPDNVRVNAILIGSISSGQTRRRAEATGVTIESIHAKLAAQIPLGHVGSGRDYADLASFLLSKRSGFITGTAINLDGGASPAV